MVMLLTETLIMAGIPLVIFIVHHIWPEKVEKREPLLYAILVPWAMYTFLGTQIVVGKNMSFIIFSVCITGALASVLVLIDKKYPELAQKYDKYFRAGAMIVAAVAVIAGGRLFG